MSFSSRFRVHFPQWLYGNKKRPLRRRPKKTRLLVELLEDRTVMSALPPAVVSTASTIPVLSATGTNVQSVNPSVVIDPLNSNNLVEVHTTFHPNANPQFWSLEGNYSTDAGKDWIPFTVAEPELDPATFSPKIPFVQITDPSVSFDRNHHFYVVSVEQNNPATATTLSGAIVMQRFDATNMSPTSLPVQDLTLGNPKTDPSIQPGDTVIYRWYGQDPAANPIVAIDTNTPLFTDPTTGQVQTDTLATMVAIPAVTTGNITYPADLVPKAIYVGYNTYQSYSQSSVPPSSNPAAQQSRVFMVASADGGRSFSAQELVSDLLHHQNDPVPGDPGVTVPVTATQASSPQIIFAQGRPGVPGGQMMVFYNDITTNFNNIYYAVSQPDGGVASAPAVAAKVVSNNQRMPIQDAQTNTGGGGGGGGGTGTTGDIPEVTDDTINVDFTGKDINSVAMKKVTDLTVTINMVEPHMDEVSVVLIPPNGLPSVTLLLNRVDNAGNVLPGPNLPPQGLPDNPDMGELQVGTNPNVWDPIGTVFDDSAPRVISDPSAVAPFIGHFQPEAASLRSLVTRPDFLSKASGTWTLEITDFRNTGTTPAPTQYIENWSMDFTGDIGTTGGVGPGGTLGGFGKNVPVGNLLGPAAWFQSAEGPLLVANGLIQTVPGGPLNVYPTNTSVAPAGTPGIGPTFSVAIDNTLGSFSPFEGRVYLAYTNVPPRPQIGQPAPAPTTTNIELLTVDNLKGSASDFWAVSPSVPNVLLGQVDDDSLADGRGDANRTMFNPKVAVDPVTGTLGVMWYDGRVDPALVRVANSFTTSIDGGVTFAPDVFINQEHTATDFYSGATVNIEPIPNNMTIAGPLGFGDRSGLAMYGGHVYPVWSGNLDQLPLNGTFTSEIFTNTVTVAGGPRLLSGDMGSVVSDFLTGGAVYNNTFTTDNTRQLNGFVLTFDRPVDPGTLNANMINITYRDPTTPAGSPGTDISNQITSILPLGLSASHGPNDVGTPPSLSISDTIVQEPKGNQTMALFTVILSQAINTKVAVDWSTQDGTGPDAAVSTGGNPDYVPSKGTLIFQPDQMTASFQVPILNNSQLTNNRYFLVNLTNSAVLIDRAQGKGTIIANQNIPAITVGNAYVVKGNPNGPSGTVNPTINFPVFLSVPAPTDVSVDFSFTDGTAVNGTDYVGTPGTLTILKGNTTGIITASAISNQLATGNLNFLLDLTNPVGASVTRSQAEGVIVDDNELAVSAGDLTVQRTEASQTVNVTFNLNGITSRDVTVNYQTVDGTAVAGTDYTAVTNGTVVIPAGMQTVTVPITIAGSTTIALNETFQVQITSVLNAAPMASDSASTITIVDDNMVPAIVVGDAIARQAITGATTTVNVPVYLTSPNPAPITINVQTVSAGTNQAVAGTDFTPLAPTPITIPVGTTTFSIPVTLDGNLNPSFVNPTFGLQISSVTGGKATIARNQGIVTIVTDGVQASVGDATVNEIKNGNATANFTVFLSGPSEVPVVVTVKTVDGTAKAGTDYTALAATAVTFNPGQTQQTVPVTITYNTAANDVPNAFQLQITGVQEGGQPAPLLIAKKIGGGTIVDSDATNLDWTIGDVTDAAPTTAPANFLFPILLNQAAAANLTVNVTTKGSGIVPLNNFQVSVPSGATTVNVPVSVLPNLTPGADGTFSVTLSNPSSGTLVKSSATGTIVSNSTTVSIGGAIGFVGHDPSGTTVFNFPGVVSNALPTTPTVTGQYSTADGIGPLAATLADGDYVQVKNASFNNKKLGVNSDSFNLPVQVKGTLSPEGLVGYETFTTFLSNTSVFADQDLATGYIVDANLLNFNVSDTSVLETPTGATMKFTVYLNGISGADSSFTWNLNDGTALAGVDYGGPTIGTTTIPAGSLSSTISVPVLPETKYKGNRTFTLTITGTVGAGAQKAVGTGTILDTELTPTLTLSDATVKKGPSGQQQATFTVFANYSVATAASPGGVATTMTITPSDFTATAAEGDYVKTPVTVTIPAGATSATFSIPINGDTSVEGNETFRATISNPTNGDVLAPRVADQDSGVPGEGLALIVDDNAVTAINIGDVVVALPESGQQVVNVPILLTTASPVPITFQVDTSDGSATTADHDYAAISDQIFTIPANTTKFSIPVTIFGRSFFEGDKSFVVTITNPQNATVNKAQATVTIIDGDSSTLGVTQFLVSIKPQSAVGTYSYTVQPLVADRIRVPFFEGGPSLTVSNVTVQDKAASADFTLVLSQASLQPVTVVVSTTTDLAQTLHFSPGVTGGTFTLSFESKTTDPITWSANTTILQSNIQAALNALSTVGLANTIVSNAANPVITFQQGLSGPDQPTLGFDGSGLTGGTITNITTAPSAVAGTDYTPVVGQLVIFAPGTTTATVSVPLVPVGQKIEPFRTFSLTVSTMTVGGALAPPSSIQNTGTASIVDQNDTSATSWSIGDVTAGDGNAAAGPTTPFTFTISTNQSFASGIPTWLEQGPASVPEDTTSATGAVESVAVDPNNPAHMIAGSVNGGVWQTANADPSNPAGIIWTPVSDDLASLSFGAIAFDPSDVTGKTFYAGTGLWSNSFSTGGQAIGLYKTTNGGQTWTLLGQSTLKGHRIRSILVSGQTILVGTVNGTGLDATASSDYSTLGGGLYRSIDGGKTFAQIAGTTPTSLPSGAVVSTVTDPNVPGLVFVGVAGQGVYSSANVLGTGANNAVTWTAVNAGLSTAPGSLDVELASQNNSGSTILYAGISRSGAITAASKPGTITITSANHGLQTGDRVEISGVEGDTAANGSWVITVLSPDQFSLNGSSANGTYTGGGMWQQFQVYASIDEGNSWGSLAAPPAGFDVSSNENAEKFQIVADPTSPGVVYIDAQAGTGIFRYNPVGTGSWVQIDGLGTASDTSPHVDSRDLEFIGNNTLVEADDGGIYVLQNPLNAARSDWKSLNGSLKTVEFYSVNYDPTNNILFGGAQDNGSPVQNSPNSQTWTDQSGGDGQFTAVDTTSRANGDVLRYVLGDNWGDLLRLEYNRANVLVGTTNVGLRSSFGAADGSGLDAADQAFFNSTGFDFQPFVLNSVDPRLMLLGYNGVYEDADPSAANGDAGDVIKDITSNVGSLTDVVSALAYGGMRGGNGFTNVAVVGTRSGQLFFRGEAGTAFTEVDGSGTGQLGGTGAITSVALDPTDWRQVYVLQGDQLWFTSDITNLAANPFKAIGGGANDNLGQLTSEFRSLAVVRVGSTTVPLVGALGGVYRMTAPGVWSLYGRGLPNADVSSIVYNSSQDLLIAGTFGRGAWTISNASASLLVPGQVGSDQTITVTTSGSSGDYIPLVNQVTLPAGQTSTTVTVPVYTGLNLSSNATFTVTLSSPSAGVLGQKIVGTGTILNNNTFDQTELSSNSLNWQNVVPKAVAAGSAASSQQNVAIDAASVTSGLPSVTTSTINISGIDPTQVLRDMTVTVNAEFPDTSSLLVELIAPNNGPTFTLSKNEPGANFPNTVFDDQAATSIAARLSSLVQTISVDATGGSFTISFEGVTTAALPWNAAASLVQNTLQNLPAIGAGNISVSQSGKVYTLTFSPSVFTAPPLVTVNSSQLTGNSHTATVAPVVTQNALEVPTNFRPETPLSAVAYPANQLNGTWTLRITNSSPANFGILSNWSLRIQTGLLSSEFAPQNPTFSGSLGNPMNQVQNAFTASVTRDPTDIFAVPNPVGGVPLSVTAPYLAPPYDQSTLPLIIPGPHQDVITYTTTNVVQTLNFSTAITGGTFTLSWGGRTTQPINWSVNTEVLQGNIQAALNALPTIGPGNTIVSNAADPTITFVNALSGGNVATLSFSTAGLIGGTITGVSRSTVGSPANPLNMPIPAAINNPHTNVPTPGVLNVPLVVANAPAGSVLTGLTVRIDIEHTLAADLRISLVAPDGTTILLSDQNGDLGANYDDTTFDDSAAVPINLASAPFHGSFAPQTLLSTFNGKNINGTWNLRVEDMKADGQTGAVGYWQLIPTTSLVLNQTSSFIDVAFDRQINVNSINASNVVNMLGPIGQITGPFTVTPNPTVPGTSTPVYPPEFTNRVFRIGFPTQQNSGSYSVVIGPVNNPIVPSLNKTIQDLAGNAIDNNLNAGLYTLNGADPTNKAIQSKTYITPTLNQVFVPGGAAFSTLTVPDDYLITQDDINHIQVQLTVKHSNTPDLIAILTAPDGTRVTLFSNVGIFGAVAGTPHPDLGNNTVLDDFALNPIQSASAGLAGSYKPQTPLSALLGKNARGTWSLTILNQGKTASNNFSIGIYSGTLVQWSLTLPFTVPGTGLGETGADQMTAGFRIFQYSPNNEQSYNTWTAVGPAPETGGQTGPVGAIAVDPADPSGNTVYAGAANGGVWKTYNFLTTDPKGPNWIPLTDLGPLSSLNIGSIAAVASPDGDPNKTTIIAGTGTSATPGTTSNNLPINESGVGFLRSTDGGRTWMVIDSSNVNISVNTVTGVQTPLPISSTLRNHLFDGTAVNKVIIDPTPVDGKFVMYAALTGPTAAQSGVFRSVDSGLTWTQMESGLCTDIALAGGSKNGSTGLLQVLYAGFETGLGRTGGVYISTSASGAGNNSMLPVPNDGTGQPGQNQGVNTRINTDQIQPTPPAPYPVISVGPSATPSGATTPVILATPGKTNNPLKDALYQGWIYAYTNNTLFESKDFGQNWTQVNLPFIHLNNPPIYAPISPYNDYPTSDTTQATFTDPNLLPNVKSIAIDPNNPNIIYVGGLHLIRVDLTTVSDVYSFVNYNYSAPGGTLTQTSTVGDVTGPGAAGVFNDFSNLLETNPDLTPVNVLDMLRDPQNPFLAPTSLQFTGATAFTNDGTGIKWQLMDQFDAGSENQLLDLIDPLTGKGRLFTATSAGVYTAVDQGGGVVDQGVGSVVSVSGSRNGNLQIATITETGAEPSVLAATIAGAALFAENPLIGVPMSDPNLFQNGNIAWGNLSIGYGEYIAPDPTGSGTVFRYQYPYVDQLPTPPLSPLGQRNPPLDLDAPLDGNDFFQVNPVGTIPSPTDPLGASRALPRFPGTTSATTGLIQAGDFPDSTGAGQWPGQNGVLVGSAFTINSLGNAGDYQGMVMSSRAGRIFRASNISLSAGVAGIVWQDIGDPNFLDGTYAPALAFGSPVAGAVNVDDFIYAGTLGGHIFVTFTGGGANWKSISTGLDGSPVLSISADPARGSHKVVAITEKAVYYCADSSVANPVWVRLSDTPGKTYIFPNAAAGQTGIQRPVWNNPLDFTPAFNANTGLTSLAVDWRYAIPDNLSNPTGPTHPVLYVGGDGGVVVSTNLGTNWSMFPNLNITGAGTQTGGYLPELRVTDLKFVLGNANPVTGIADSSSGLNTLVASTYGRGDFAIRIDDSAYRQYFVVPHSGPQVASVAPLTGTFGEILTGLTVTFKGPVDPTSFSPSAVNSVVGPSGNLIPVQYVFDATPTPPAGTGNPHNVYQLVFATPQTVNGTYTLLLGPNITNNSGNVMNQNGNSTNGEVGTPGFDDRFFGSVTFAANTPPTISVIKTQQAAPGTPLTVNFTVADTTDPAASLTVAPPTSSDQSVVPDNTIVLATVPGTNGAGHTLTITPASSQPGVTFITLNVTDPRGLSASETFEVDFDTPAQLPPNPGPQTVAHGHTLTLPFNITSTNSVSIGASALPNPTPIYNLWTIDQFAQSGGTYYQNSAGMNEKWVKSQTNGKWYIIQPTGAFSVWNGGSSFTPVTTDQFGNALALDNSYWQDPTKLTAPAAPAAVSILAKIAGTVPNMTLQVTPPLSFVGQATVTISVTDGIATSSLSFPLTVTNAPPTFNTIGTPPASGGIPVLSVSPSVGNVTLDLPGNFSLADTDDGLAGVTLDTSKVYAANAAGLAYELDQTYGLYFTGNYFANSAGRNEKWVRSLTTGKWFIIEPSGAFSRWDGGSTYTLVATLDNSYWQDPTTLVQAVEPPALAANISIDDTTHKVTLVSTPEVVKIAAFDGLATATQFFNLAVAISPPVFSVPNQQLAHNAAGNPQLTIDLANQPASPAGAVNLTDPNGKPVTTTLAVYNYVPGKAYDLSTSLNLQFKTSYFQNSSGRNERWLFGQATGSWYIIEPNGNFSKWNGGSSFTLAATLNLDYWNNPNLLINISDGQHVVAPTPLSSSAAFTFADNANVLTFTTNGTVAANYFAVVTATDALSSTTHNFELSFTSPVVSFTVAPQNPSVGYTTPASATISTISAAPDPVSAVTFSSSVYSLIPGLAYQLALQKAFFFTGSYSQNFAGLGEKWIKSQADNTFYIIEPTGKLSKWNGGSSFTQVVTDGVPVVLGPAYWSDPTLLINAGATPPPDLAQSGTGTFTTSITGSNATGLTLTVDTNNKNAGNFVIQVKGNDAGAVGSQFYVQAFTDSAPTFGQPVDQSVPHLTHTATLDLSKAASFVNPAATPSPVLTYAGDLASVNLSVKAYYLSAASSAYQLNSQLALYTTGNLYQNSAGLGEIWVKSQVTGSWYIIEPSGKFSVWNGGSSFTFLAQLDASYFNNPTALFTATEPVGADQAQAPQHPTPAVTSYAVDVANHTVTVNTDPNFVGTLIVKVTATDPAGLSTTRFFKLSVT
jgi:subtilisin-like proprotein convertase family protein